MDEHNKKALLELEKYKAAGAHMLVPCMQHIDDVAAGFRLIITPVSIKPHPRDKDVYPDDGKAYDYTKKEWKNPAMAANELVRIHGQGLERLAQNANIIWSQPTIETDRTNKGRQVAYITGALRMPDGFSFYRVPDLYGMDLDIEREKAVQGYSYNGKFKPEDQWKVDRDVLQKKTHQPKLCISGAKNRVIRKILGLANAYAVADLSREFVMVRIIPWLDMNDEYTRRAIIDSSVKQMAIANLFGGQPPMQIEDKGERPAAFTGDIPADKCHGDDVIDVEETTHYTVGKEQPPEPGPSFAMAPEPSKSESLRTDFLNTDAEGQCNLLLKLADSKGFSVMGWLTENKQKSLSAMPESWRPSLYDFLAKMPDKKAEGRAA